MRERKGLTISIHGGLQAGGTGKQVISMCCDKYSDKIKEALDKRPSRKDTQQTNGLKET